jgi:hypothetical protein
MRVAAYTYEADHHCTNCATNRFGAPVPDDATDGEGNPVGVIFDTDEALQPGDVCGTCGEELDD